MMKRNIVKSITYKYLLAVSLIALLSTAAFYALKSALDGSDSTAYIVNISGKQRMLSQHIALTSHRIYQESLKSKEESLLELKAILEQDVAEMLQANKKLSSGRLTEQQTVSLSEPIWQMYFGEMNLFNRVNDYLKLASLVQTETNLEAIKTALQQMDHLSEPLLVDLNKVVAQYQKEGEAQLKHIEQLELLVWMITLVALVLEVLFIFRPMAQSVAESKASEAEMLENLNELVEVRTYKLEQANRQLQKLASHDVLTGLKNRLTLEKDLEFLQQAYQAHKKPYALVMLDIDWFKKINDSYGHLAGDAVLKAFAGLLQQSIREGDAAYRIGGEEFVILFNRITLEGIRKKLDDLLTLIANYPFEYSGHKISLTASFGCFHPDLFKECSGKRAMKLADDALYKAKFEGRNRIVEAGSF